jgi:hypothetical protein
MDYRNLCRCMIEELRKTKFQVMLLEDELRREKQNRILEKTLDEEGPTQLKLKLKFKDRKEAESV